MHTYTLTECTLHTLISITLQFQTAFPEVQWLYLAYTKIPPFFEEEHFFLETQSSMYAGGFMISPLGTYPSANHSTTKSGHPISTNEGKINEALHWNFWDSTKVIIIILLDVSLIKDWGTN